MAYDRWHLVLQWGGTLPGGEIWSNSLRLANQDMGTPATRPTAEQLLEWLSTEIKDELTTWHTGGLVRINVNAKMTYCKLNMVDLQGHYVDSTTNEYVFPAPVPGANGAPPPPNQIALVVSLTTGRDRGHAHRGRFYVPLPVQTLGLDGLIGASDAQNVADQAAVLIEALGDEPGIDGLLGYRVSVMSSAGTGATYPVTGVEVGRVLDTQRRRRRDLKEQYASHVVDQGAS